MTYAACLAVIGVSIASTALFALVLMQQDGENSAGNIFEGENTENTTQGLTNLATVTKKRSVRETATESMTVLPHFVFTAKENSKHESFTPRKYRRRNQFFYPNTTDERKFEKNIPSPIETSTVPTNAFLGVGNTTALSLIRRIIYRRVYRVPNATDERSESTISQQHVVTISPSISRNHQRINDQTEPQNIEIKAEVKKNDKSEDKPDKITKQEFLGVVVAAAQGGVIATILLSMCVFGILCCKGVITVGSVHKATIHPEMMSMHQQAWASSNMKYKRKSKTSDKLRRLDEKRRLSNSRRRFNKRRFSIRRYAIANNRVSHVENTQVHHQNRHNSKELPVPRKYRNEHFHSRKHRHNPKIHGNFNQDKQMCKQDEQNGLLKFFTKASQEKRKTLRKQPYMTNSEYDLQNDVIYL